MVDVFGFQGSTGDFVVTLERIDPTPLDLDAPVAGSITDPDDETYYTVTVPAGVKIDSLQVDASPGLDVIVDLSTSAVPPSTSRAPARPRRSTGRSFGVGEAFPRRPTVVDLGVVVGRKIGGGLPRSL